MPYQLPPDLEAVVQKYVTSGGYASADDVLREALAALDRQDDGKEFDDAVEMVHERFGGAMKKLAE